MNDVPRDALKLALALLFVLLCAACALAWGIWKATWRWALSRI